MSSAGNYTQGPWQVNGSHIYGPDPQRELVAQAHGGSGEGSWSAAGGSQMVANRNLIAIAPEMYEAMAEFVHRCEIGEVRSRKTYAKFKEILAKAEGR